MNILVTGGLGGVGRPLVQRLLRHGHAVRVLDRANEPCPDGVKCVVGDITDFAATREHVRGMDAVIHLAALPNPAAGPGHDIYRVNTAGTFNVYEAAAQEGIRRVVSASSINALGFNYGVKSFPIQYLPMDEAHPTCTTDAYSFSKQIVEEIGAYYWRREGISGVQLRLPFVYPADGPFRDMVHKFMALSAPALKEFLEWPEAEQRAQAQRVISAREQERPLRLSEKPWDPQDRGPGDPDKIDPLLMMSIGYTDFWAIIGGEDSAQAFEKGVTATYDGSHPLFACEDRNSLGLPSELIAKLFFPDAALRRPIPGHENLVSIDKARQLIGFAPEHHIGDWSSAPQ